MKKVIILLAAISVLSGCFWRGLPLKDYNSEHKASIETMKNRLESKYGRKVRVEIHNHPRRDQPAYPLFRTPLIHLSIPQFTNPGWRKDFMYICRALGIEVDESFNLPAFLIAHEYKHILHKEGRMGLERTSVDVDPKYFKNFPPHHRKDVEVDANYFACKEVVSAG